MELKNKFVFAALVCAPVLYAASVDTTRRSQVPIQVAPFNLSSRTPSDFEKTIVDAFLRNDCPAIETAEMSQAQYFNVRPTVIAAIAYCKKDPERANELFTIAEKAEPANTTILLLRARYVWKRDAAASMPLWQDLYLKARTAAMKQLARDYLQGTVKEGEEERLPGTHDFSFYTIASAGGSVSQNPGLAAISQPALRESSYGTIAQLAAGAQYDLGLVSLLANYAGRYQKYFNASNYDYIDSAIDFPFTVHAADQTDLQLRPYLSYSLFGRQPLQFLRGVAVKGIAYRPDFTQSVQGSIYADTLFPSGVAAQGGTHYRFDYSWEFYPSSWFLRLQGYVEHVEASADIDDTGTISIPYSHNDVGLLLFSEYNLRWVQIAFAPQLILRLDDNDSSYYSSDISNDDLITKHRRDLLAALRVTATFPIERGVYLNFFADASHNYSSIGPGDYTDRNYENYSVGTTFTYYFKSL